MRKYVLAFLIGSAVVLNPMVFTILLPRVGEVFGEAGNAYVQDNETWMVGVATGYFLIALTFVVTMWTGNRLNRARQSRATVDQDQSSEPYRGPGGGKRPPRSHRGRSGRPTRRLRTR